LLLVTSLAQQLLLSWPGSSGTTAAFGGVLASLAYYVSLWLQWWSWMKEESRGFDLMLYRRRMVLQEMCLNRG
jgi:hypothetical protein